MRSPATWWYLVPVIFVTYVIIVACAFVGACLVCLARDFIQLISLGMMFLMFTSGIFWDVRALGDPHKTEMVMAMNPLAFIVDCYRQIMMHNTPPDMLHLLTIGAGFGALLVRHGVAHAPRQPVSGPAGAHRMSDNKKRVMIELDNVSHSYHSRKKTFDHGTHHVLNQVSLQLYEGETLGIIGRNGVGKTTLLQLMAGILAPTIGEVRIHPGKSASLLTLGLGFKPDLSGRDNALLAAMLQGSTRKQAESFLDDIAEFSELGDSFNEPVKNYSSGMRSRLAFTTALMTHVDVLLIDEILSVGDAHFRGKAQAAMTEPHHRRADGGLCVAHGRPG